MHINPKEDSLLNVWQAVFFLFAQHFWQYICMGETAILSQKGDVSLWKN